MCVQGAEEETEGMENLKNDDESCIKSSSLQPQADFATAQNENGGKNSSALENVSMTNSVPVSGT